MGQRVTREQPIDESTLEIVWNWILDSAMFQKCQVNNPQTPMDWDSCHVVATIFGAKDQPERRTYLIPASDINPEFDASWLVELNIPNAGN